MYTSWCTDTTVAESNYSANMNYLMLKCRPFYFPRQFTFLWTRMNAKIAMENVCHVISKQQNLHPNVIFILTGDFNHSNLRNVFPKFHQDVSCPRKQFQTMSTPVLLGLTNPSPSLITWHCSCSPNTHQPSDMRSHP